MGGIDIKKLRAMGKDLAKKSGEGEGLFLYSNKMERDKEVSIRILTPPDHANGVYFVEQTGWWIDGKFYLTNDMDIIGGEDVIAKEIAKAKAANDEDLDALIAAKKGNGMPILKKEFRYLVPVLLMDVKYDGDDLIHCKVEDYRVLVAKPTLLNAIHSVFTSRPFQNGTAAGITDRVKGNNLELLKSGEGTKTKYTCVGDPTTIEVDEKWYNEAKMPNVWAMTKESANSDERLVSVIRNYLYGDTIIEDTKKTSDTSNTEAKTSKEPVTAKAVKASTTGTSEPKKEPSKAKRSIIDDVEDGVDDGIQDL